MSLQSARSEVRKRDPENRVLRVTLLLTSTLIVMVTGVIPPALPAMEAHFAEVSNTAFWVRLVLTIPCLFIAVTAPIAGFVVDRIGRKSVLVISTVLFASSGVAGYLASTLPLLLITRASLGIAVGGLMTSVTTLIADYYHGAARGRFVGLQAAVMGFAGTASLVLGGLLADIGWRVPFLTYSLAILILPLILLAVYEPLLGERCARKPPPVSNTGQCVAESICALRRIESARAPISSVSIRFILSVYVVMMGIQVVMSVIPALLPFYLQGTMGASAFRSGLAISVTSVSYALASLQYGRVASRPDHAAVLIVGFALIAAGYLLMWSAGGWAIILPALFLAGAGQGLLIPNVTVWLASETPSPLHGRVLGGLASALFLGVFLSPIVAEPISAAIGFHGLCLGAGASLLVMASLVSVSRNRIRSLTDFTPRERENLNGSSSHGSSRVQLTRNASSNASQTLAMIQCHTIEAADARVEVYDGWANVGLQTGQNIPS
jgi:MFS family permease